MCCVVRLSRRHEGSTPLWPRSDQRRRPSLVRVSPHLKIFCKKRLPQKGLAPFWGRNRFWTGFWERGHEQFSKSISPPYRGVTSAARSLVSIRRGRGFCAPARVCARPRLRLRALWRIQLSSFAMRWTVPVPMLRDLATLRIPTPFAICFRTLRLVYLRPSELDALGDGALVFRMPAPGRRSCLPTPPCLASSSSNRDDLIDRRSERVPSTARSCSSEVERGSSVRAAAWRRIPSIFPLVSVSTPGWSDGERRARRIAQAGRGRLEQLAY